MNTTQPLQSECTGLSYLVPLGEKQTHDLQKNSALLLSENGQTQIIPITHDATPAPGELKPLFADKSRVFVCAQAKPCLLQLLNMDLQVARPICLDTLHRLIYNESPDWLQQTANSTQQATALVEKMHTCLQQLLPQLKQHRLHRVARLECLVLPAFARMQYHGLPIDVQAWQQMLNQMQQQQQIAKQEVLQHAGQRVQSDLFGKQQFNLDDNQQTKQLLQDVFNKPLPNVSQETLRNLNEQHPMIHALLKYRELAKLTQTYGEHFLEHVNPKTGRIHGCWEPLGTNTGRAICHSPNLQNFPTRQDFRRCIRAPQNHVLITADYAACELRIMASLSQDQHFLQAFEQERDLHSEVAARMFQVSVSKQNNAHLRKQAKTITFGLLYGMGSRSLARQLQMPQEKAQQLIQRYFAAHPQLKTYLDNSAQQALQQGYACSVLGRRFVLQSADNERDRSHLERVARNMPIQATGADMLKLAMLRLHERMLQQCPQAQLVNTVHDELLLCCPENHAQTVQQWVQQEMLQAQQDLLPNVKPQVDIHVGSCWQH
ncbi:MAG: DNA polymerase A family protein [Myxococcota bacterium]